MWCEWCVTSEWCVWCMSVVCVWVWFVKGVFVVYMCEWCVCMGVYSGV